MTRHFPIAWVTLRSQWRTLWAFLGITLVILLLAAWLPGLRLAVTVSAGQPAPVQKLQSLFGLFQVIGVLLAVVLSSRSLPQELRNRTTHLLFTRPVSRWRFVLEKWLGNVLATLAGWLVFVLVVLATIASLGAYELLPRTIGAALVVALMMTAVASLTTLLSLLLGGGLSLFVALLLSLISVSAQGMMFLCETTPGLWAFKWVFWALPPLTTLSEIATRLLAGEDVLLTYVFGSMLYCYLALLATMAVFYRREV